MLSQNRKIIACSSVLVVLLVAAAAYAAFGGGERAVSMRVVSRQTNDTFCQVLIGFTNRGPAITFRGYSVTNPIYFYVHGTATSAKTKSAFWCGTGMSMHTLRGGQGVEFLAGFIATNAADGLVVHYSQRTMWDQLYAKLPPAIASRWNKKPRQHAIYVSLR